MVVASLVFGFCVKLVLELVDELMLDVVSKKGDADDVSNGLGFCGTGGV